jgi:hypothetical protein
MLSIRRMDKIYKEADNVLVFDATLETQSSKASPTECLTRIGLSTWTTRLWTMRESLFARRLHFKFKDGVETINGFLRHKIPWHVVHPLCNLMQGWLRRRHARFCRSYVCLLYLHCRSNL